LSLDPATVDSDFIQVKHHKDQTNDKDYSYEGVGFSFKNWQADNVAKHMKSSEVAEFEADKGAGKENVRKYMGVVLVQEMLRPRISSGLEDLNVLE
jgi:hypothetical protein